MKTEVIPSHEYSSTVADEIVASINEVLEQKPRCSLCLSGGTTPAAIYRLLGLPPRVHEVQWQLVDLFWGDERFVPAEDPRNNARMVHDTLLHQFRTAPGPIAYPINTALSTAEEAALTYEGTLKQQGISGEGDAVFDIVLLGIGEDGHTASLFPHNPIPDSRLAFSCEHPTDGTSRISLTPTALFSAKQVYFLVTGANKSDMLGRILRGEGTAAEYPALHAAQALGNVIWFADSEASGAGGL